MHVLKRYSTDKTAKVVKFIIEIIFYILFEISYLYLKNECGWKK